MIIQKSRCTWLQDGDSNSKLLFSFMKSRFRRNDLSVLNSGTNLIEDPNDIKTLVIEHFQDWFKEPHCLHLNLDGVDFGTLTHEDGVDLEIYFSLQELKDVV